MDTGPNGPQHELPFVIGVLADFSGIPEKPLTRLRDRRFVDVDLSNLREVLAAFNAHLSFSVPNRLSEDPDAGVLKIELRCRGLDDLSPYSIASQISPLRQLLELRNKLTELKASLRTRDGLDELLQATINDAEKLNQVRGEIGGQVEAPAKEPPPAAVQPVKPVVPPRRNWKDPPVQSPPEAGVWSRAKGAESTSILDQLVEVRRAEGPIQQEKTRDFLKYFLAEVTSGNMSVHRDTEAMINARVAQIDHLVSVQLSEVLHHPDLQRLETCWRGLHFLLRRVRKAANVKVRVLNIGKKELLSQFQRERARNWSPIARKVLDHAAETPGAPAYTLLIGGFEIGRAPDDVELVEKMARLGAVAHVPFIAAAAPDLLGVASFTEIVDAEELNRTFEASAYLKWNSLRARPESRYVGLVLPGMMIRLPYGRDSNPVDEFNFEEGVDGADHSRFLWGSAAWALAARFAFDFERYGWFGAPRAAGDQGEIPDLPVFPFCADEGDLAFRGPAEIAVNDARCLDLRNLGFIPLCQIAGSSSVVFFETWSCHKPTIDPDGDPPTTYESAQIDCVLDVSRIAHYLRAILQQERHRFASAQDCEEHLHKWVAPYIVPDYARGTGFEAAFPLLDARFHIAGAPDYRGRSKLEAAILPRRAAGALSGPVEIAIAIALPWALTQQSPPPATGIPAPSATLPPISFDSANGSISGRGRFIRHMFTAEACINSRKLDVAVMILEDLAAQIDRYHLDEWESPRLVTQVWDLLRRCYLLTSASPEAADRSVALLRRICRLDPSRAIE